MKKRISNWTSTRVPLWEADCLQFWRAGLPFELRDVTTVEHNRFVASFAVAHQLSISMHGTTATFNFAADEQEPESTN